ncbi:hypothetical protein [Oceanithermus sp.]|uniref:phage head spike fiber domain-containing protein n=1 Tax=Oceanithermus sp. TaxID=2268145 RepID=UPI00257D0859|nr:hypothetical protein [Oceanithermus sp.]
MPQTSKYVPAPFKKSPDDTYGDPAEVFTSRLLEVAAGVGLQSAYFPSDTDLDNGSPNLLDHPDHTFFAVGPANFSLTVFDRTSGFDPTPGAAKNWTPRKAYSVRLIGENYGATADLPSEPAPPAWYKGGSADLWNYNNDNVLWWEFGLEPNTTYTFSFYYKKLGSADWSLYVDAGTGSSGTAAYDLFQDADGLTAGLGVWARKVITFTTGSSGVVYIHLGGRGSWDGAQRERGLRLAFPQLEKGATATAWQPPRFWVYHPLPAPVAVDETIDSTNNYASMLALALPGSAVAFKLDARPDWTGVSLYDHTRRTWSSPVSTSSDQTDVIAPEWYAGSAQHPLPLLLEPREPGLGVQYFSVVRYSNYTSHLKFEVHGVWVRHKPIGGLLRADTNATSGAGHNKALAWRVVDAGAPSFKFKVVTTVAASGFEHGDVVALKWYGGANGDIYDNSQNTTASTSYVRPHASLGAITLAMTQDEDLFIDAIGNAQGLALAFYQAGAYKVPVVLADFLDPPSPADDGSTWARWGLLVPHDRVGYVVAATGPLAKSYQLAWGPNFHTPPGWNNTYDAGQPAVPYYEVALGTRLLDRTALTEAHAARSDSVAANRGRLANVYLARDAAFSANLGDSWLAEDGNRYVFVWRQTIYSNQAEAHLLLVKP